MIYEVVLTFRIRAPHSTDAIKAVIFAEGSLDARGEVTYISIDPVDDPSHA